MRDLGLLSYVDFIKKHGYDGGMPGRDADDYPCCPDCIFSDPLRSKQGAIESIRCVRHAPKPTLEAQTTAFFPEVSEFNVCGDGVFMTNDYGSD